MQGGSGSRWTQMRVQQRRNIFGDSEWCGTSSKCCPEAGQEQHGCCSWLLGRCGTEQWHVTVHFELAVCQVDRALQF